MSCLLSSAWMRAARRSISSCAELRTRPFSLFNAAVRCLSVENSQILNSISFCFKATSSSYANYHVELATLVMMVELSPLLHDLRIPYLA